MIAALVETRPASTEQPLSSLTELVYELLDAHADTAELLHEGAIDLRWSAHLEYLRALQRLGRERLALIQPFVFAERAPICAEPPARAPGSATPRPPG